MFRSSAHPRLPCLRGLKWLVHRRRHAARAHAQSRHRAPFHWWKIDDNYVYASIIKLCRQILIIANWDGFNNGKLTKNTPTIGRDGAYIYLSRIDNWQNVSTGGFSFHFSFSHTIAQRVMCMESSAHQAARQQQLIERYWHMIWRKWMK